MKRRLLLSACLIVVACLATWTAAAQSATAPFAASAEMPNVINSSGVFTDFEGKPLSGIQGVTFLLYGSQ